jgi:hypothetical protein
MKRLLSVALAVLAAAACSDTNLPAPGGDPRLEFTAEADPRDYLFPTPRASILRTPDGLAVQTMMTHPDGCRDFDATLDRSGNQLEVTVEITHTNTLVLCRQGPANYTYTARLIDLAPGSYYLVVRHVYPNDDRPDVTVLVEPVSF